MLCMRTQGNAVLVVRGTASSADEGAPWRAIGMRTNDSYSGPVTYTIQVFTARNYLNL